MKFNGFSEQTFDFFIDLALNNYKSYFEERRSEYQEYVQKPLWQLEQVFSEFINDLDSTLITGKRAVSRIYRDTRFSKDKTPFRDHMWIAYKHRGMGLSEEMAYYFEISPVGYVYGLGMYTTNLNLMNSLRAKASVNISGFERIISKIDSENIFVLKGDDYVKPKVSGFSSLALEYLNKKFFFLSHSSNDLNKAKSKDLAKEVLLGFESLKELYQYVHSS